MNPINTIWYFLVGLVQGVSESFPVSSSAQTKIASKLMKLNSQEGSLVATQKGEISFEIMLNLGSAIAILLIFLPTIKSLVLGVGDFIKGDKNPKSLQSTKITINIIITTLVTGILGLILKSKIEELLGQKYQMIIMGAILILVMCPIVLTINYLTGKKQLKEMSPFEAIFVGIFQTIALLPGLSRLGLTLLALKTRKFSIVSAIKYSFLIYLPVSFLASIKDLFEVGLQIFQIPFIIGAIAAFIGTYLTFNIMVSMAKRKTLKYVTSWLVLSGILSVLSMLV